LEKEATMNRRNALSLIAFGAFVPSIAIAQERHPSEERHSSEGGLGQAARNYMQNTLEVGSISLAASRIAQEKARNPLVRHFANYETAEQEGVAEVLKSLGATPPSQESEDQTRAVRGLNRLSGLRFDAAYLHAQAQGHDRLLRIQNDFIATGQDPMLGNIARLIRGKVEEHIDMIRAMREQATRPVARR
jgi:putative membrane protein